MAYDGALARRRCGLVLTDIPPAMHMFTTKHLQLDRGPDQNGPLSVRPSN